MTAWRSRGYVPHIDAPDLIQHITFHLADSLPAEAVERMRRELAALPEDERPHERQRIEDLLDAGAGSCMLRRPACARVVQDALLFGDGPRYRLLAWVVMPNHVHVMIQRTGWPISQIVQSWKRHTSREIHRIVGADTATSALWQREYWDRYIRDERHYLTVKYYIEQNPVRSRLVVNAADWPWSHVSGAR